MKWHVRRNAWNEIFDLVIRLKGTLSGEHGVGSEKRAYVGKEIDHADHGADERNQTGIRPKKYS